ncbi:hypothetical protein B0I35DRAFT_446712 [Stachybotrys elegans]|uniref:Heterokaryon incompatibility domain-containing protein n=1 Tax=Stachybotrys elegans TaxID=80388 RepID=A0A8K0SDW1_9HYPO|nr:hypothetical protein B0I35DRAFT_446712 [Stachybotrys elegans]
MATAARPSSDPTQRANPWEQEVDLNTEMLLPSPPSQQCPNSWWYYQTSLGRRIRQMNEFQTMMKSERPTDPRLCPKDQLLRAVFAFFTNMGFRRCHAKYCEEFRQRLRSQAPTCQWSHLHDSILTLVGCWAPAFKRSILHQIVTRAPNNGNPIPLSNPFMGLEIGHFIFPLVQDGPREPQDEEIISEVINILDWLRYLWFPDDSDARSLQVESRAPIIQYYRRRKDARQVNEALKDPRIRDLNICPHWIWNLAIARGGQCDSLSAILDCVSKPDSSIRRLRKKHTACNEQICFVAFEDAGSAVSLHKCHEQECHSYTFDISLLSEKFRDLVRPIPWVQTAWDVSPFFHGQTTVSNGLELIDQHGSYIAISHVWADGTGVGAKEQGHVNSCLVDYWADIAQSLECKGLWWDSICLPIDKASRRKALDVMLLNFEKAKYVIVHDQDLAHLPYPGSKEAAIALVFSTWFTRGWTSAELYSSRKGRRKVKVIFKHPTDTASTAPYLVDLEDMLWDENGIEQIFNFIPTLAHMSASRIIRQLLTDIDDLPGLQGVLQTRSTSWLKDKAIIASLLVLQRSSIDSSLTMPELTRNILRELGDVGIPYSSLVHGQVPMTRSGGWSWCPPSIFDMGTPNIIPDVQQESMERLAISHEGVLSGYFTVFPVLLQDIDKIHPLGHHPAITMQVRMALEDPTDCWILGVGSEGRRTGISSGFLVSGLRDLAVLQFISCVYWVPSPDVLGTRRYCYIGE